MDPYKQLLMKTMGSGIVQYNKRTGKNCKVLIGEQMQYDISESFPLETGRKMFFDGIKGELLGFFRGYTSAADFRKLGCNLWTANANQTQAWLDNPYRQGEDDCGRVYSAQWTGWIDRRIVNCRLDFESSNPGDTEIAYLEKQGYKIIFCDEQCNTFLMERRINQLENALRTIITNPSDRRCIISGWNPGELDLAVLPPCHMDYRYVALEDTNTLHLVMTQRSMDLFLGAPTNIASTALQLMIMARLSGYNPGTITIQAANIHIYDDHYDQTKELLLRQSYPYPKLILSDNIKPITDLKDIKGVFTRIEPSDIILEGYQHGAPIKAIMAT